MTELSNDSALPENAMEASGGKSPWTMLITMALLTAGLLFSGILLIRQAQGNSSATGSSKSAFAALLQNGQLFISEAKVKAAEKQNAQTEAGDTGDSPAKQDGVSRFFQRENPSVRWPKLKLTGFGSSTDGESSFAIINGQHVIVGQKLSKVTVIEIGAQSVIVEYKGEHRTLSVDPTN